MKTEEILRYESEFKAMQKVLGTSLLVFEFPKTNALIKGKEWFELGGEQAAQGLEMRNGR